MPADQNVGSRIAVLRPDRGPVRTRTDHDPVRARALAQVPLFRGLDPELLTDLDRECERLNLPGGTELFRQGDAAEALYIVLSGRLEVVSEPELGQRVLVGELGRGASVGEMSLLTGER